jgi:dihydroorotate dehydrogenase
MIREFLISPPFGNYLRHPRCTTVRGSFTARPRPGLVYHTLKTLRPTRGGWVNRVGLRNGGIAKVNFTRTDCVYSLVGLDRDDWEVMLDYVPRGAMIEVNLGCPNVHEYGIELPVLRSYCDRSATVSAKLPPNVGEDVAALYLDQGVSYLHLSNTVPTPRGGESGAALKKINLPLVERMRKRFPDVRIIAGGGIYGLDDVEAYRRAGADHFSLSTLWFRPWRALHLLTAAP